MNVNVKLCDRDYIDIEQSDLEDMWDIVSEDVENLLYLVKGKIESLDTDYWKEYLVPLYETLKNICEE